MEKSEAGEGWAPEAGAGAPGGEGPPSAPADRPWAAECDLRPDVAREAIRGGGELFQRLFDCIAVGLALLDLEGRFIDTNPALQRMLGYGGDELRRMGIADFVHPDDLPDVQAALGDMRHGRAAQKRIELRYIRKGWEMRWGRLTGSLMSGLRGGPPVIIAALENITEQTQIAESLRTTVAKYRDLVDNATAGVAIADSDGKLTFVNGALCALGGYSEEDLLGHHFSEFIPPEDLDNLPERFGAVFDGRREELAIEFRLVRKDGGVVHCYTSPTVSYLDADLVGYTAIIQDITERKRTEGELVRLSTAVKLIRESILIMDIAGNVNFANEAASGLVAGCHPGTGGWNFAGRLSPPERAKWRLVLAETFRRGSVHDVELDLEAGDGRLVPIEVSTTAMIDVDGKTTGIVAILRDIAERKLSQRQMRSHLMAFRLEEGYVYLVKESAPILSVEGFRDLLRAGYRGTALSRTPPRKFAPDASEPFGRLWLSEKATPDSLTPRHAQILSWVDGLPRNHAILIDRLDYLISRNGFRGALELVHHIREVAYLMGHIVIISLDPATLDQRKLRALEKEASELAPRNKLRLPPEQLELIRYVFEQNISGARPTLTEVGDALRLSKPTARKRARDASRDGYIALSPRGRTKVLELTEKGRGVFSQ